nr:hypothetical protein B0A51_08271 [Rachicladosporium sp. CCFEE 5018]
MAATASQPQVVVTSATSSTPALGSLFTGLSFFILQRVPSRSHYVSQIKANGGHIVALETAADYRIADHLRRDSPPGSVSYTFLDVAIASGALPDPADHQAGPSPGTVRTVGDASVHGKATRTKFTHADDVILWEWVMGAKRKGGSEKGLEIYKQLEAKHPQHTTQSWRDRWVKTLSGREKPAGAREVEEIVEQGATGYELSEPQRRKSVAVIDDNDQAASPATSSRQPFTEEDDRVLKDWVNEKVKLGELVKGNKIYRALAEKNPRHTAQSWRDRYVRHLVNQVDPDATAPPTPSKGRVTFTEEDDLALWNWVVTSKAQSSKCWVKGTQLYKELAKTNKRHPWRAWRDRYVRVLRAHPPADGLEEMAPVSDDEDVYLTKSQFDDLMGNAPDIESVAEDQVEDAWDAWAEISATHSAEVWQRLYEEHVRPVYLKQVADEEARDAKAKTQPPKPSPTRSAYTPDRVGVRSNSNSSGARKRKRASPVSSQRRAHGRKRAKGDGSDIFSDDASANAPSHVPTTPELLATQMAPPAAISQEYGEVHEVENPQIARGGDAIEEGVANGDYLPTSEANRAAEQQLLAHSNRDLIGSRVKTKDYLPTSEANHAAEQQLYAKSGLYEAVAVEDDMDVEEESTDERSADEKVDNRRTSNARVATQAQKSRGEPLTEVFEQAPSVRSASVALEGAPASELGEHDDVLDRKVEARTYASDAEDIQHEGETAAASKESLSQQRFDEEVLGYPQLETEVVVPPPVRALTVANLADFESQITPAQLRATDLVEDGTDADQTNFASYLHSLLPAEPDEDEEGEADIPDRLMDTPEEQDADAIVLESDRELSLDDSDDEEAQPTGVNIEEVFSQNLDWPSSPVKSRRVESSPIRQESQGWGFETQLAYPDLANEALEAARAEAGAIASQVADVVPALSPRRHRVEPIPQLRSPVRRVRSTTPLGEPRVDAAATQVQRPSQRELSAHLTRPNANAPHEWSREEDTAITDAMQRSSRAADTLAELDLPGRSLPAIRRRSAVLLQQRPSLMGGWDEDEDEQDEVADSAPEPALLDHVVDLSQAASLHSREDTQPRLNRTNSASAVQIHNPSLRDDKSEITHDDGEAADGDEEIDLTIPEPEGGFDIFSSQQEMPPSSPRRKIEYPDLPRETVAEQHAEVMEISSAASLSDSSDDDELEHQQPKALPLSQQSLRMLNTQAILDAETQAFDLSMPLPPDSDEEDVPLVAQELPVEAVQVPASSKLPSTKPQLSSAAPIRSTPIPPPFASSASKPRSSRPFTKPSAPTKRPPIPTDEILPSFVHRLTQLSYPETAIWSALHRTSMRFDLAQALLISEKHKQPLSDLHVRQGIWIAEEDRAVFGGSSGGLRRLTEKFGWDEVERRMRFLEEWESA